MASRRPPRASHRTSVHHGVRISQIASLSLAGRRMTTRKLQASAACNGIRLSFDIATEDDAPAIAALLNAAADHLTSVHGQGHWSGHTSERGVVLGVTPPVAGVRRSVTSRVLIAYEPRRR